MIMICHKYHRCILFINRKQTKLTIKSQPSHHYTSIYYHDGIFASLHCVSFFVLLCDTRIKCFFQGSFISTDEKINVYLIHMGWIKLLDPKTNSGFPICRRTKLPITSFSKWHHSNRKLTMEICSNLILNIWNSIPKEAILICVNNIIIILILLETWQC